MTLTRFHDGTHYRLVLPDEILEIGDRLWVTKYGASTGCPKEGWFGEGLDAGCTRLLGIPRHEWVAPGNHNYEIWRPIQKEMSMNDPGDEDTKDLPDDELESLLVETALEPHQPELGPSSSPFTGPSQIVVAGSPEHLESIAEQHGAYYARLYNGPTRVFLVYDADAEVQNELLDAVRANLPAGVTLQSINLETCTWMETLERRPKPSSFWEFLISPFTKFTEKFTWGAP